jgi:hypothetical protein
VNGTELLDLTRVILRDTKQPGLWTDTTIYQYLTEAQRKLAERTFCVVDASTHKVTTAAGVRSYTLAETVLMVSGAQVVGQPTPLRVGFSPNSFFAHATGVPLRYTLTGGPRRISFDPTPDAVYSVSLVTAVRPEDPVASGSELVVPESYHAALAHYAAAKCLLHNDSDGLSVEAVAPLNAVFTEAVRDLKREVYHYRIGPDANVVPRTL